MKILNIVVLALAVGGMSCAKTGATADSASAVTLDAEPLQKVEVSFDADSAYAYVERQVGFGPRVPGTESHAACGRWLEAELRRHGAEVVVQEALLKAFDGTPLPARNIMGRYNPGASDRTLLLAHWDTRPWADNDPDAANHRKPVDGADDGASGVGVLLEVARQLADADQSAGIDILFVDAEDCGTEGSDDSWALGARHFVQNPPIDGYRPSRAILLDMVGGAGSVFRREYFSDRYAPALLSDVWEAASLAGHDSRFSHEPGGAITDDHLEFIKAGIPAIDIIACHGAGGFPPYWHTVGDNMDNISAETLGAVGRTVMTYLKHFLKQT